MQLQDFRILHPASLLPTYQLFEPLSEQARVDCDTVCRAFMEMYRENHGDFQPECRETDYEEHFYTAYPIHLELFDRP